MSSKSLAIMITGRTFAEISETAGDFDDWIAAALPQPPLRIAVRDGAPLPDPKELSGVIITGSHDMVTDAAPWSEGLAAWLRDAIPAGLPVLGICYGHQLLAHVLGGTVGRRDQGIEFGTVPVTMDDGAVVDPLFNVLPASFAAHVVHEQSVITLPENAVALGHSAAEPHQIIRFAPMVWGVQFHPEFMADTILGYGRVLGIPALGPVTDTPHASRILPAFAALAQK